MFIVIPTNDRINIEQKSGRAKEFAIFDLNNLNNVIFKENSHKHHDHTDGHHEHSHKTIIDMFRENNVEILIVDVVGKHFKKDLLEANIKIYKTKLKNLIEIASSFKNDINDFEVLG